MSNAKYQIDEVSSENSSQQDMNSVEWQKSNNDRHPRTAENFDNEMSPIKIRNGDNGANNSKEKGNKPFKNTMQWRSSKEVIK